MGAYISHKGKITAIGADSVTVAITPDTSECGGCAISALCSKGESIEVPYKNPSDELIGRHIEINISQKSHTRAVVVMLVVPLLLLVGVLAGLIALNFSETAASIAAIACVAAWYISFIVLKKSKFQPDNGFTLHLQ